MEWPSGDAYETQNPTDRLPIVWSHTQIQFWGRGYFSTLCNIVYCFYRGNIETGSLIISSQVAVQRGDDVLTTPVTIAFDIIVENFTEPECVFWEFSDP